MIVLPLLIAITPLSWIMPAADDPAPFTFCLITNLTGYHCPGCGMTRAIFNVMHGQLEVAWGLNWLIVVVFPLLAGLWIAWIVKLTRAIHQDRK